jgi:hypothetical protein
MRARPGSSITFAVVAAVAATLAAAEARAGYWKQQGAVLYPNKTMAPHVQGAATGPDHNGTCIGHVSAAAAYSETRDMGKRSAWGVVVHEQTKWQASVNGIPNVLVPGQVVPFSGKLMLLANSWRGTDSWVGTISISAHLSRLGAAEFPGVNGRIVSLFGAGIDFGGPQGLPKTKTINVANTAAKAPGNDVGGRIYLVWRAVWGVAAGIKNGDVFEARVPYVWVEGKPPVATGDPPPTGRHDHPPVVRDPPTGGADPAAPPSPKKLLEREMGTREAMKANKAFFNGNDGAVANGGKAPRFTLKVRSLVTFVMTYHHNHGRGVPAGTIMLLGADGTLYGPWKVAVVNKVYWVVAPNVVLPPGAFTVIDSAPATWSQNQGSRGFGHVMVKAAPQPAP